MRISSLFIDNRFKDTNIANVTCMCNRCYTLENAKISIKINAELLKMDFDKRKGPIPSKENLVIRTDGDIYFEKLFFDCEVCNDITCHQVIDSKIAPAIAMLNGMGYYTEYCGDGHYDLDIEGRYVECVYSPHIYFKSHLPKEALDIIPIDWDVDNTNEKGTIISNSELVEVIKNKNIYASEAEEFLQSARESLFNWIEKLPNLI